MSIETRYYIVETEYVGPTDEHTDLDQHTYEITTDPKRDENGEIQEHGTVIIYNDVVYRGHGGFDNYDDAVAKLEELLSETGYREDETGRGELNGDEERVLLYVRVGEHEPLNPYCSRNVFFGSTSPQDFVNADTTDEEIASIVDDAAANFRMDHQAELDQEAIRHDLESTRDEMAKERDLERRHTA